MTARVTMLSGLGATGSERLINLIDSIPLVDRSTAVSVVRDFEKAVADAAEARVEPKVRAAVKKGILISVGASAVIGLFVLRRARR